MMDKVAG